MLGIVTQYTLPEALGRPNALLTRAGICGTRRRCVSKRAAYKYKRLICILLPYIHSRRQNSCVNDQWFSP